MRFGAVVDCLEQFHGESKPDGADPGEGPGGVGSSALRQGIDNDLIYHAEPFDVACKLAGVELDTDYIAVLMSGSCGDGTGQRRSQSYSLKGKSVRRHD